MKSMVGFIFGVIGGIGTGFMLHKVLVHEPMVNEMEKERAENEAKHKEEVKNVHKSCQEKVKEYSKRVKELEEQVKEECDGCWYKDRYAIDHPDDTKNIEAVGKVRTEDARKEELYRRYSMYGKRVMEDEDYDRLVGNNDGNGSEEDSYSEDEEEYSEDDGSYD